MAVYTLLPNSITFWIYSSHGISNAITSVTITYIAAQISAFNGKLMFYTNLQKEAIPLSIYNFTSNFGIPSVYNSYLTQKCIIGLTYILYSGSARPSTSYFADSGTLASPNIYTLIDVNMATITYTVFTMMECDLNNLVDVIGAPTQCYSCSNAIPGCLNCTRSNICVFCGNFYLLNSTSNSCNIVCNITNCISCTIVSNALNCASCNTGYHSNSSNCNTQCGDGFATPDEQCDVGNTLGTSGCSSTCQISLGWNCTLNASNFSTCYQCKSNCASCLNATQCISCLTGDYMLVETNTCYITCPANSSPISATMTCALCSSYCVSCTNLSLCLSCASFAYL